VLPEAVWPTWVIHPDGEDRGWRNSFGICVHLRESAVELLLLEQMTGNEWQLIGFSVRMALASLALVLPVGLAVAWWLAKCNGRGKSLVETCVTLPLVLPPVVTGLLLLRLFGRRGPIGGWLHDALGIDVVFTWRAVVMALAVMSLPLFVRAARTAFEEVDAKFEQMARTLGAGEWRIFFTITLPLARRGVLAGTLLAFARALGEFGATIMVAGNIPGRTTTVPVAIYQSVQTGDDARAWTLAGVSALIAFGAVLVGEILMKRRK
jgi:molybdate transport system permease protein